MAKIRKLDKNLVNQIAAGEVIDRPSAVVKELVENSIDAGAIKLEIEVDNSCRDIRVADNGSGIDPDDIELAFSPHSTSKIQSQDDLWELETLGFRGEALASIISVAKVTCISRTKKNNNGIKVECKDSEIFQSKVGCAVGTIMEVKDLFYNTPVRLKFLKTDRTEYSAIIEILQNIAIAHPGVSIVLKNSKTTSLRTTGSNDFATVLSEIYSNDLIKELKEIYKTDDIAGFKIGGFVSEPNFVRSNRKAIYTFVNGRVVKCPIIIKAISLAYEHLIPRGKFPFAVIDVSLPKNEVDVNVHPTKREIRYTNGNQVFNFVYSAVKKALEFKLDLNLKKEHSDTLSEKSLSSVDSRVKYSQPLIDSRVDFASFREKIKKTDKFYEPVKSKEDFFVDESVNNKESEPDFEVIGQYKDTYILLETKEGLQIIDQHIAHERYIYEQLLNKKEISSQLLLVANPIQVNHSEYEFLRENRLELEHYGFKLNFDKDNTVYFKKLPQLIVQKNHQDILQEILNALESSFENIGNEILISMSCQAAVKANTPLGHWQMKELIEQWKSTKYPYTCPHGRRIVYTLSPVEIASFFGRLDQ